MGTVAGNSRVLDKDPVRTFRTTQLRNQTQTTRPSRRSSAPPESRPATTTRPRRAPAIGTAPLSVSPTSSSPSTDAGRAPLAAVVLADSPLAATTRIAGLSLAERGARVARAAGATAVIVVRTPDDRAALRSFCPAAERLLVIRAGEQLVHSPLVRPLVEAAGDAVATAPAAAAATDLAEGAYAGAFITSRPAEHLAALAAGADDAALAAQLLEEGATRRPHGEIARHPARNPDERRAAEQLLYRILVKPQDNAIARLLFRPLSLPLTKLLAATPVTPNQITTLTMIMVAIGLWLAASAELANVFLGSLVILASNYVDCCDGEIARLKLRTSRLGAWYDTIVDELSSLGYMLVIGWHCHLHFGPAYFGEAAALTAPFDPWLVITAAGAFTYLISLYCVYFNIIRVARSANSQDYISRVEVVAGAAPGSWELRAVAAKPVALPASWPRWMATVVDWLPNIVRRDFIVWASMVLVAAGLTHAVFLAMVGGGILTAFVVAADHLRLRGQLGQLRRRSMATGIA
jgi:phosphatidylglycerophosphate synthase